MKANELMIGDWIYSSFYYNSTKPCRITGIRTFDIKDVYAFVYVDKVEDIKDINSLTPIPLTQEILEKNGFIRDMFYGEWQFDLDPFPFSVVQRKNNSWYLGRKEVGIAHNREIIEISYVHQLQHALRLCEIEKTIEL